MQKKVLPVSEALFFETQFKNPFTSYPTLDSENKS